MWFRELKFWNKLVNYSGVTYIFANSLCIRVPSSPRIWSVHEIRDLADLHSAMYAAAPTKRKEFDHRISFSSNMRERERERWKMAPK